MRNTTLPIHPRTGLQALGWSRRGPIWPILGASDDDPPADGGDPPDDDPPADPSGDGGATPLEQQALDAVQSLKDAGAEIPKALETVVKEFRDARREAANHRSTKTAEKQRADDAEAKLTSVLTALGINGDNDNPPDPDTLKATIDAKDGELRQARVELAAYRAAAKVEADPDALLDSASFLKTLKGLDPEGDTFSTDLESAIKKAVEDSPRLKVALPGGGRRGPGQGPRQTPKTQASTLEAAFEAHYSQGG